MQSFVNGASPLTRGVDFLGTYPMDYGPWGHVDYALGANYSTTGISSVNRPPPNVNQAVQLLDPIARADLTTASPKYRFTFSGYWTKSKWSVNLRENFYGSSFQYGQNDDTGLYEKIQIDAAATTDLEVGYEVVHNVKLYVGAYNLFNTFPTKEPDQLRLS